MRTKKMMYVQWHIIFILLILGLSPIPTFAVTITGVVNLSNLTISAYGGNLVLSCPSATATPYTVEVPNTWSGKITPKLTIKSDNSGFGYSTSVSASIQPSVVVTSGYTKLTTSYASGCNTSTRNVYDFPLFRGTIFSSTSEPFDKSSNKGFSCVQSDRSYTNLSLDQSSQDFDCTLNPAPYAIIQNVYSALTIWHDANIAKNNDADWWAAAVTSDQHWYYYIYPNQWIDAGVNLNNIKPAYQGSLFDLGPFVLDTKGLPRGTYIFYFGADTKKNGILDFDQLYYDSVGPTELK